MKIENLFKNTEKVFKKIFEHRFLLYKIFILLIIVGAVVAGYFTWQAFHGTAEEAVAGWYEEGWTRRAKITINKDYTQGDLTDFPVLISTTSAYSTGIASSSRSDGRDIIFTDARGEKLYREIEKYDSQSGELVAWVKVPDVASSTDTILYMYYGNPGYDTATSTDSFNVWDDNFVGVWHLDEDTSSTTFDSTVNSNTGSVVNTASSTSGKVDNGFNFASTTSDYVDLGNDASLNITGAMTVEVWFKTAQNSTSMVSKGDAAADVGWKYWIDGSNYLRFYAEQASGANATAVFYTSVTDNEWHHAVGVYSPSNYVRLYVDGILGGEDTSDIESSQLANALNVYISRVDDGYYFGGTIDEARISNSARSADFIRTSYNNQNSPSTFLSWSTTETGGGPIAYWSFNEGYASTTYDRAGNNNGTLKSNTTWVDGKFGKGLSFDGTDDYVSISETNFNFTATDSFTVGVWAKTSAAANQEIVQRGSGGAGNWFIRILSNGTSQAAVTDTDNDQALTNPSNIGNDGNWHYYTLVYDGNKNVELYMDAASIGTGSNGSLDANLYRDCTYDMAIGVACTNVNHFNGQIDEPKIWNRALSASEIHAEYASGGRSGGAVSVSRKFTGRSGDATGLEEHLVGYWKMDEATSTWNGTAGEVFDSSGMGNHGTSTNATSTTDQAKYGLSGGFDGSGDYVDVADADSLDFGTDEMAASAWIYVLNLPANISSIIDKKYGGTVTAGYNISLEDNGTILWRISNGSTIQNVYSTATVNDSSWHHVTGVLERGTQDVLKIYIDGVLNGQTNTGSTYNIDTSEPLFIGSFSSNAGYVFDGYIDDVKIFNVALTPDEVMREYVSGPGPVGYWRFEEQTGQTANDISGNFNEGTLGNTSAAASDDPVWNMAGKVGGALLFDGTNDFVDTSHNSAFAFGTGDFTIQAWIKHSTTAQAYSSIISRANSTTFDSDSYWMALSSAGTVLDFWVGAYSGAVPLKSTTIAVNDNKWHHVLFQRSGTTWEWYIDGVSDGSTTGSYDITDNNSFNIGIGIDHRQPGLTRYWDGSIDEVKIYNYARDQRQIMLDYNGGGPVGYWKFDEGYASTTYDGSGQGNNGTLQDNTLWDWNGKFGKAVSLDGINDYVGIDSLNSMPDVTVEAWIKTSSSTRQQIVSHGGSYSTSDIDWMLEVVNTTGVINFHVYRYTNGKGISTSESYNDGEWHHVAATIASTTVTSKIYVDGVLKNSRTVDNYVSNSDLVQIGVRPGRADWFFDGDIDEVKIFNYARTAEEIRQDFLAGGGSAGKGTGMSVGTLFADRENPTQTEGLVGWWKFDETATSTAADSSGAGNTGTDYFTTASSTGKYGYSREFNTVNSYVDVGDSTSISGLNTLTMELWFKRVGVGATGLHMFVDTEYDNTSDRIGFMYLDTGYLRFSFKDSIDSEDSNSVSEINDNEWHHIAVSKLTDGTATYYVDGVSKGTKPGNAGSAGTGDEGFIIGARADKGSHFTNGLIDDVKVYNVARTADEIMRDYLVGPPPVGYWRFEEQSGTSAYDSSENLNTGTITGASWTPAGGVGGAINFDGTDDYVDVGTDTSLNLPSEFVTFEAWIKLNEHKNTNYIVTKFGSYILAVNATGEVDMTLTSLTDNNAHCGSVSLNEWVHIVGTYDGTNMALYVNGVNACLDDSSGNLASSGNPTYIGSRSDGADFANGFIDEVKIYNYALTQRQISMDYNGGKPIGHWKFDRQEGDTAYDSSGNSNNGTIYPGLAGGNTATSSMWTSATTTASITGKINGAMDFDGTDDYVTISEPSLSSGGTIEAWLKTNDTGNRIIAIDGALVGISNSTTMFLCADGSGCSVSAGSDYVPSDNVWAHVAMTWDNTTLFYYYNGNLVTSASDSGVSDLGRGSYIGAGDDGSGVADYFDGIIDDVRIYNYARSQEEIRRDYNNGAGIRF